MVGTRGKNVRRKNCEKSVLRNIPEGNRSVGRPRKRWLGKVENCWKKICVRGWRKIAKDRDGWKLILKEARILIDRRASGERGGG